MDIDSESERDEAGRRPTDEPPDEQPDGKPDDQGAGRPSTGPAPYEPRKHRRSIILGGRAGGGPFRPRGKGRP